MAVDLSPNAQASITPLVWTRGHQGASGLWDADTPWEGDGGHIAFMDGHVTFYENTTDQLVDASTNNPTADIEDAIGTNANILELSSGGG